jgi:hypothetical protein
MHCVKRDLTELARGRPGDAEERNRVASHLSVCPDCRQFLEEQMVLTNALSEIAAERVMAPAGLESVLLAEFESTRSRRRYLRPALAMAAIAAALACVAVIRYSHAIPPRAEIRREIAQTVAVVIPPVAERKPVPRRVHRAHVPKPVEDPTQFVTIPYTVPLDPRERVTVMRVDMPVSALVAVGLSDAPADPGGSAQADVVVGEDGRIRAIRLVSFYGSDRRINQ